MKLEKGTKSNEIKERNKNYLYMAGIEDKADKIEKFLKDNNLKILRKA